MSAYIRRKLHLALSDQILRGKSILLLGPRQVGKTTLLREIDADLRISMVRPTERLRYEKDPDILVDEIEALSKDRPLVVVDEVQRVPSLMDVAQYLIDEQKAQLILTGSSARKLKRKQDVNLLPGRVIKFQLDPFLISEFPNEPRKLESTLVFGSLPEIVQTTKTSDREKLLETYVETYLEEEVRAEALVRDLANFSRLLELAGIEAGRTANYAAMAQHVGVSHRTIQSYFQILVDCLVAERVDPITTSASRNKLVKSPRFLLFDLGVRRLCAREGHKLHAVRMGEIFEQWVGLELIRLSRFQTEPTRLSFWRDSDGPEVDWVIEQSGRYIPVEVKWAKQPPAKAAKHVETFLSEYQNSTVGYVVCRSPRRIQLTENVVAIPWQDLPTMLE